MEPHLPPHARSAHGRANHALVRLESRPPARDDREDRASRSSAVIFCCARPPRLARLARGIDSCAPQVWIPAGIIFAHPPLQLHDGQGASTLQVRPRPPAAAVRPRKSRLLTPRQLVRARRVRLHLWAPRRSTSSGADGAGGCVGGRSRRRRVRRCGRRSPTAYPASSARICAQNRPRRRAASPRGASVCLSCVV